MNALLLMVLSSSSFAATPNDLGPYRITIPGRFGSADRRAVDQDANVTGTQIDAYMTQGPGAGRVSFWTDNVADANGNPMLHSMIGRTNGADNGYATAATVACGKVVASGIDMAGRTVIWTPRFNTGPVKFMNMFVDGVDADQDGLSDIVEVSETCSDPNVADTDGGGVNDGDEFANGSNLVSAADDFDRDLDGIPTASDPDDDNAAILYAADTYTGNLEFADAQAENDMANFCQGYADGSRIVDGYVWIHDTSAVNLHFLSCVAEVTGQVAIVNNTAMGDLHGLENLSAVGAP